MVHQIGVWCYLYFDLLSVSCLGWVEVCVVSPQEKSFVQHPTSCLFILWYFITANMSNRVSISRGIGWFNLFISVMYSVLVLWLSVLLCASYISSLTVVTMFIYLYLSEPLLKCTQWDSSYFFLYYFSTAYWSISDVFSMHSWMLKDCMQHNKVLECQQKMTPNCIYAAWIK